MLYLLLFLFYETFFITFQSFGIYAGDAGDLVTAAYVTGVAHPPGFPLYTLLGHLLTMIPIATVAWRVSLLSSISSAATLTLLTYLLILLTNNKWSAIITTMTLAVLYPFWLYSIVPEVFALHLFFLAALLLLLVLWSKNKDNRFFFLFLFFLGLALSHHHLIIFLMPAFLYWIYQHRSRLGHFNRSLLFKGMLMLALGLTPYIYIFIAAHGNPPINWNNATNVTNFLRLVTRADYGTFQSGPHVAQTFASRLLQVPVLAEFITMDFTIIGVLLILAGIYSQLKSSRSYFTFFFLAFFFSGPFYFFYASYLFTNRFSIGTLERFILPMYVILAVWLAYGIGFVHSRLSYLLFTKILKKPTSKTAYNILIYGVFLVVPFSLFYSNYPKLHILKNDFTAENYAKDTLDTVEKNSILFLERDNTVFNVQYVYYTMHYRPDVKLIHSYRFTIGELTQYLKNKYPELILSNGRGQDFIDNFIKQNYPKFPIYANTVVPVTIKDGVWLREGLLLRFYLKKDLPPIDTVLSHTNELWKMYSDPLKGSLGNYRNLMLSNILDFYSEAHIETGVFFEGAQKYDIAASHYKKAIEDIDDNDKSYFHLALIYLKMKKCEMAQQKAKKALFLNPKSLETLSLLVAINKDCLKNQKSASFWQKKFDDVVKEKDTPLNQL